MSGWVHVFAIKMLSIIFPLKSNPCEMISHVKSFKKTEDYKLITILTVIMNGIIAVVIITVQKHAQRQYDSHQQMLLKR